MKITFKFNVNFLSIVLKYTLYLAMSVFWKSCWLYHIPLLHQECRFTIFCKILLSKSVCRRFSTIKLSLKNFGKLTESYMKLKVAGWKDSSAGTFLHNPRGVFRTISNIYDEAFSCCIFAEILHHRYLARVQIRLRSLAF